MIISHSHRFIFVRTRKTASTSIEIVLSKYCDKNDVVAPIDRRSEKLRNQRGYRGRQNHLDSLENYSLKDWRNLLLKGQARLKYRNHMPAEEVRSILGGELWSDYYTFCFERNPWDKVISYYYFKYGHKQPVSLAHYILSGECAEVSDFQLYTSDGRLIVDYVGRYENLVQDLERILEKLNLPDRIDLPRAKSVYRKDLRHYRDVLGKAEADAIGRIFSREIELLGYRF